MEKFWKNVSQNEYKKCFDILNTESLIERETYIHFATELFEIAKKQLGCSDTTLRFVASDKNDLGFASIVNNTVTLNINKMEKQTLYKTVSTIYHELTHIRQDKYDSKKEINTVYPAEFPFVRCYGNENFLPPEILGISPFLFYYTCQHEKQARDVGSECAMELFVALKEIAQNNPTKTGTERHIDRCIQQVQTRWDRENNDNQRATAQIKEFLKQNPNFVVKAFEKIKQEFINDANKYPIFTKERNGLESRFNVRIGVLVLLGCDENLKKDILNFVSANFVNKAEMFNTYITIIDSPYSKVSKNDFDTLFKLAKLNNCPKQTLLNLLVSWDKNYVNQIESSLQNKPVEPIKFNGNNFEL